MGSPKTSKYFLLITYPASGHITPILELVRKLTNRSLHVTETSCLCIQCLALLVFLLNTSSLYGFFAQHVFVIQESTPTLPDEMLLKPPELGYLIDSKLEVPLYESKNALLGVNGVSFSFFHASKPFVTSFSSGICC